MASSTTTACPATNPLQEVKSGVLYKHSHMGLFWKKRWIKASNGQMMCSVDPVAPKFKTVISLEYASIQVKPSSRNRYRFEITTAVGDKHEFAAATPREVNEWIRFLRQQLLPQSPREYLTVEGQPSVMTTDRVQPSSISVPDDREHGSGSTLNAGISNASSGDIAWNEMYQSIIEKNEDSFDASVTKAKALNQLMIDFVSASIRISKAVVEEYTLPAHLKTVEPLDRNDSSPEDETFMQDGIVLQYMQEQNGTEMQDEVRRKTCTHDLHGIRAYANTSISGLYTYLCCIVDYLGYRLFCLALVPIYDDSHICYGRADGTYHIDSATDSLLMQAASELGLATHEVPVVDPPSEASSEVDLARVHMSAAIMIHKGEDQRIYITNLTRAFPIDRGFTLNDELPGIRQLRPEFVKAYKTKLSPDAFIIHETDDAAQCDDDLEVACQYLREHCVPDFVKELNLLHVIPTDSAHLTDIMHARGINVRYLGQIANLTLLPHVREIAICEMVARSCKQLLNQSMRTKSRLAFANQKEEFTNASPENLQLNQKLLLGAKSHVQSLHESAIDFFKLVLQTGCSSSDFWTNVLTERLQRKYNFQLKPDEGLALHRPLLLASLQYHCGIWLKDGGMHCQFGDEAAGQITIMDLIGVEARCKWPEVSKMKCHLFPEKAEQYMEDGSYDRAIQALLLKLDVILCDKPESKSPTNSELPPSLSSLPPPPPPPHRKGRSRNNSISSFPTRSKQQLQNNVSTQIPCLSAGIQSALNDLCEAYVCNGDIPHARYCAKRALELSVGPDARTSATYTQLVNIYRIMNENTKSDQCLQMSLSILRHLYGLHHPLILRLLDDVGIRSLEMGLTEQAHQYFQQGIDLALTSLGKSHPTTAQFYTRLGNAYHLESCLDQAKNAHEKACLIYEGVYGAASVDVARSCFYLSDIMAKKGDHEVARYYNQRALKIRTQLLGDNSHETLDSIHQVAWQAHRRDDHAEAIPFFEKLLAHFKSLKSPSDEALYDIKRMTKAVIRLSMRALPVDTVAFLDRISHEYKGKEASESDQNARLIIESKVIRKLYQQSPGTYFNNLLEKTSRGAMDPEYANAIAEILAILNLMENSDDDAERGVQEDDEDDVDGEPDLSSLSYAIAKSPTNSEIVQATSNKEGVYEDNTKLAYILGVKPSTIVKS